MRRPFRFSPALPSALTKTPAFTAGDLLIVLGIVAVLFVLARLSFDAPKVIEGPDISLSPLALPWYAALSLGRMSIAYLLSLGFSLVYGYAAARNRTARVVLMPLLDVLQSVPILSFLPVVVLSLSAIMPLGLGVELSAIALIFTSQAWNMTFSFYQSMKTIPMELREAAAVFRFDPWMRFKTLELPSAAIGLIWNSMMSWSGGWFFLMFSETFKTNSRDFRLPGLGSYLQTAADAGDVRAIVLGLSTLIFIILFLDQFVWRPILATAERYKIDMVEGDEPPVSWFLGVVSRSWILSHVAAPAARRFWHPFAERIDARLRRRFEGTVTAVEAEGERPVSRPLLVALAIGSIGAGYLAFRAAAMLSQVRGAEWVAIGEGLAATVVRVAVSLAIALLWTIPVGVAIGTNRKLATILQPAVQTVASIPATALFPIVLIFLLPLPGGLNLAAVFVMLMGTQWYLLFNVIAGASAIPQDLRYTTDMLRLSRWDRWRTLILPALFPYIVTGAITASGGAWNVSIAAEHAQFRGQTRTVTGIGSIIAQATDGSNYPLLLAGTLVLVAAVILINRIFWLRLYRIAEERYRME